VLGSVANRTWNDYNILLPWAVVCIPLALLTARWLNLLQLGDDIAEGLGLRVGRTRLMIAVLSAGLVAGVVAICGPIGYIALVCPHLARRTLGTTDARAVLPIAGLMGAALLTGADLVAKNLFNPLELPVGIWTTVIGGPLLLIMLRRELGRRRESA
jgi:iron complex transport system permease protein